MDDDYNQQQEPNDGQEDEEIFEKRVRFNLDDDEEVCHEDYDYNYETDERTQTGDAGVADDQHVSERVKDKIREKHLKGETLKIIESLLEGKCDEDYLLKCACLLCKSDMDDLNTERSLASFCGYPLCNQQITPNTNLKQKFKIDVRNKRLYRMEERGLFCSSLCFTTCAFLKEQMPDQPLWLRYTDHEGYDGLYARGSSIKLYSSSAKSSRVPPPFDKKKDPSEIRKETISFPYIKEEHLKQLQEGITGLRIEERVVPNCDELNHSIQTKLDLTNHEK